MTFSCSLISVGLSRLLKPSSCSRNCSWLPNVCIDALFITPDDDCADDGVVAVYANAPLPAAAAAAVASVVVDGDVLATFTESELLYDEVRKLLPLPLSSMSGSISSSSSVCVMMCSRKVSTSSACGRDGAPMNDELRSRSITSLSSSYSISVSSLLPVVVVVAAPPVPPADDDERGVDGTLGTGRVRYCLSDSSSGSSNESTLAACDTDEVDVEEADADPTAAPVDVDIDDVDDAAEPPFAGCC